MTPVDRIAIVGVGLIGGSLGMAIRARGLARHVVGCGRSQANLDVALARGAVDAVTTRLEDAVRDADVVVLGVPVATCGPVATSIATHRATGAILTDVASVKASVVEAMEAAWPEPGLVVGAHPIAGSDRGGAEAADGDLFVGRRCILTPTTTTERPALERVAAMWQAVGAVVEEMQASRHDEVLAWVSHAPHAIAWALVEAVGRAEEHGGPLLAYAGSGFEDATRIARSNAALWRDVLAANAEAVGAALTAFRSVLSEWEKALAAGDARAIERLAAEARARLERKPAP